MQKIKSLIKDQRGVAPVLELILLVVVLGALGFAGYRYYQSQQAKSLTRSEQPSETASPEAYKRTTTVPSNWKSYTNAQYKFSFSYPPDSRVLLDVIDNPDGDAETVYTANSKRIVSVCVQLLGHSQDCRGKFHIFKQTLDDTSSQFRKYASTDGLRIVKERKITFDGHPAVEFEYRQEVADANEKAYFVSGNGYIYAPPGFNTADTVTPIIFESLKLLK